MVRDAGVRLTRTDGRPAEGTNGREEPPGPATREKARTDERNPPGSALDKPVVFHPRRRPAAPRRSANLAGRGPPPGIADAARPSLPQGSPFLSTSVATSREAPARPTSLAAADKTRESAFGGRAGEPPRGGGPGPGPCPPVARPGRRAEGGAAPPAAGHEGAPPPAARLSPAARPGPGGGGAAAAVRKPAP